MKFIIASDIHGSAFWCEKLVKAFEDEKADRLLLLGDILYHGPRNPLPDGNAPKEVVSLLTPLSEKKVPMYVLKASFTLNNSYCRDSFAVALK